MLQDSLLKRESTNLVLVRDREKAAAVCVFPRTGFPSGVKSNQPDLRPKKRFLSVRSVAKE